jgi:hypothetical protein
MIAQAPILLALLGTALMAIVIFAPQVRPAAVSVSFAPPLSELVPDRAPSDMPDTLAAPALPTWPRLIDPRAAPCDAAARLALVEALAAVRRPWADAILARAAEDESDPQVRGAVARARR